MCAWRLRQAFRLGGRYYDRSRCIVMFLLSPLNCNARPAAAHVIGGYCEISQSKGSIRGQSALTYHLLDGRGGGLLAACWPKELIAFDNHEQVSCSRLVDVRLGTQQQLCLCHAILRQQESSSSLYYYSSPHQHSTAAPRDASYHGDLLIHKVR